MTAWLSGKSQWDLSPPVTVVCFSPVGTLPPQNSKIWCLFKLENDCTGVISQTSGVCLALDQISWSAVWSGSSKLGKRKCVFEFYMIVFLIIKPKCVNHLVLPCTQILEALRNYPICHFPLSFPLPFPLPPSPSLSLSLSHTHMHTHTG